MNCMDYIEIKDLAVFAYHGVMPEENVVGQKFLASARLYFDMTNAGRSDDVEETINYASICETIKKYIEGNTYNLIETVAVKLADHILLKNKQLSRVDITIKKPWAPIHIEVKTTLVHVERRWHNAYLSIGSNIGDKKEHLDKAIKSLDKNERIIIENISDYIETAPVGYTNQDDFLNAAVAVKTIYEPHELLKVINKIEEEDDRRRIVKWGPRTIDIDIILFDDLIIGDEKLTIPHPECEKREFVLKPLAQIAPYAINPVNNLTVQTMLDNYYEKLKYVYDDSYNSGFEGISNLTVNSDTKIAYFGVEGTYSQQAMERYFGEGGYLSYPIPDFAKVMEAVVNGEADYGVVPIENSSTGGITDMYDRITDYDIYIVGEQIIKIDHALIGLPGAKLEDIKTVYSHIQGIRQCQGFLSDNPAIKPVEVSSTAQGAKILSENKDISEGAIAGIQAAKVYGLDIIKDPINDLDNNSTRFIILTKTKQFINSARKISLSFEIKHESGALYNILSYFYNNGINLEKIESRPIPGKSWEYRFFVDIAGNLKMQGVKNALCAISKCAHNVKILGNY